VHRGLLAATVFAVSLGSLTNWLAAADYSAIPLTGDFQPHDAQVWTLAGKEGQRQRLEVLQRATFSLPADVDPAARADAADPLNRPVPSCRFAPSEPSGTTPKFDCVFEGGDTVKVKYGHDAEIHGEAAATTLLRRLGYASDSVRIVPRLRCYGCPRHPFVVMHVRQWLHLPFVTTEVTDGYTDFEWVSVERRFPAPAIESDVSPGWEWRELDRVEAPRAEVDAFRLLAAFLAHWDNKSQNQRLVCLDHETAGGSRCERPLAMIQDLGASFGPPKVNLARWRDLPVWYDRTTCTLSMRALPFEGATFEDVRISEEGRAQLAERLASMSEAEIERLFADARFPQFQAGTDDERDLKAWTSAFRSRVDQIAAARCPGL
jgi:hypothetical protein